MLRVEIVKRADGQGVLRCTRADGSVTWQKQARHSAFFALHDLTHFAVESAMGARRGFFGLVAEGWPIEDTTGKGSHGPLPAEAGEVEQMVGLLDAERASGTLWSAEQFLESASFVHLKITEENLAEVRKLRSELFSQWAEVPVGGVLALEYPREEVRR